jgi:hypothetical protein
MGSFWKHLFTAFGSAAAGAALQYVAAPTDAGLHPKLLLGGTVAAGLVGVVNYLRTPPSQ